MSQYFGAEFMAIGSEASDGYRETSNIRAVSIGTNAAILLDPLELT